MKLEISNRRKREQATYVGIYTSVNNDLRLKKEIKRPIRKYLQMNENEKHNIPKLMGHNKTDTKGNL